MSYSSLVKCIRAATVSQFYDVCIVFLSARGFKDLKVVDGPGDGGRDVTCSQKDLCIQLSTQNRWQSKVRSEVLRAKQKNISNLVFISSQIISPSAEESFRQDCQIDLDGFFLSIFDCNSIATSLSHPRNFDRACAALGIELKSRVLPFDFRESAISHFRLFGAESNDLRAGLLESAIKFEIYRSGDLSQDDLISRISKMVFIKSDIVAIRSAVSRLRSASEIFGPETSIKISERVKSQLHVAERESEVAFSSDINALMAISGCTRAVAERVLAAARNIFLSGLDIQGDDPLCLDFQSVLAGSGLWPLRQKVYQALAGGALVKKLRFAQTVTHVIDTDTSDLISSLGQRDSVSVVLDASVGLPMIFGLEFADAKSRYGVSAAGLRNLCESHNFPLCVPSEYVNEMASHGMLAYQFVEVYDGLPKEGRAALTSHENAYVSHFTFLMERGKLDGVESLAEFLGHFGINAATVSSRRVGKVEDRIRNILQDHAIDVLDACSYDPETFQEIIQLKQREGRGGDRLLAEHDARVACLLKRSSGGFLFATWDRAMISYFEDKRSVFSNHPGRIIDLLTIAKRLDYGSSYDFEALSIFMHIEEKRIEAVAKKIAQLSDLEQVARLRKYVEECRRQGGQSWELTNSDLDDFLFAEKRLDM